MIGLFERMGVEVEVECRFVEGEDIHLDIRGDREGILIGKHGRTLDSLELLISRMVNKELIKPVRVTLDVDQYRKRRKDSLSQMAIRLGERAKETGETISIGPFNARDRRIIHIALQDEPALRTESLGEGDMKKVQIIPRGREGEGKD